MENINSWYGFTLAQISSDSYLDGIHFDNDEDVAARLRNGANHYNTLTQNIRG